MTFDKVRVPLSNTLGKEGRGMSVILSNFNHERWMILSMGLSTQRLIVEECLKYVFRLTRISCPRCLAMLTCDYFPRVDGRSSGKRSANH